MHVFELTRALIDIPSVTPEEEQVGLYLYEYLSRLAATHNGERREDRSRTAPLQCVRGLRQARRHALHPHGYRAALRAFARRRRIHLGTRRLRYQGHHRVDDHRGRAPARTGRARFRSAVRGRRGAQQRGRISCGASIRADRSTSSTASPPRTSSRSDRRARCAMKWWRAARWRTPRIPNWAIRRSRSCSTLSTPSAKSNCRWMTCSAQAL